MVLDFLHETTVWTDTAKLMDAFFFKFFVANAPKKKSGNVLITPRFGRQGCLASGSSS